MHSAVLRQQRVRPAVHYSPYCIKTETASIISSPSDSPMIWASGKVWLSEKFTRGHPERGRFVRRVGSNGGFCEFSTYKSPYLRNGARYDQGYYWTLIGNRIGLSGNDWYKNQQPWMTLKWPWAVITRFLNYSAVFGSTPLKYEWR